MASYNITVNENVALGRSILTLLQSVPQAVTFEMPKEREKTLGDFVGLLPENEYNKLKEHTLQARKEWNRDF